MQAARTANTLTKQGTLLAALLAQSHLKTLLHGASGGARALAYSPDGRVLASGDDDSIRLWNASSGQEIGPPLTGHSGAVTSLAFSPDGALPASSSADGAVRLWRVAYRRQIGLPLASGNTVTGVAFNRSGPLLAAGSADGPMWLWDVDVASWMRHACRIANRNLTIQDWQEYLGSALPADLDGHRLSPHGS